MRLRFVLTVLGLCCACADPNAFRSHVVRELASAGAGDIASSTPPEIAQWLSNHPDKQPVIDRIDQECTPLRMRADANWTMRTAEGRVCYVAAQFASYRDRAANPKGY